MFNDTDTILLPAGKGKGKGEGEILGQILGARRHTKTKDAVTITRLHHDGVDSPLRGECDGGGGAVCTGREG